MEVHSLTPQQAAGNALALLNFPKGTLFNRASWSIFKTIQTEMMYLVLVIGIWEI